MQHPLSGSEMAIRALKLAGRPLVRSFEVQEKVLLPALSTLLILETLIMASKSGDNWQ